MAREGIVKFNGETEAREKLEQIKKNCFQFRFWKFRGEPEWIEVEIGKNQRRKNPIHISVVTETTSLSYFIIAKPRKMFLSQKV